MMIHDDARLWFLNNFVALVDPLENPITSLLTSHILKSSHTDAYNIEPFKSSAGNIKLPSTHFELYSFRVALKNQNFHEMGRHEAILSISGCLRHKQIHAGSIPSTPEAQKGLQRAKNRSNHP